METVVNTADIIRLDKDIYIYLFYKYKKRAEEKNCGMMSLIQELKQDKDYLKLSEDSQLKLFNEFLKARI